MWFVLRVVNLCIVTSFPFFPPLLATALSNMAVGSLNGKYSDGCLEVSASFRPHASEDPSAPFDEALDIQQSVCKSIVSCCCAVCVCNAIKLFKINSVKTIVELAADLSNQ